MSALERCPLRVDCIYKTPLSLGTINLSEFVKSAFKTAYNIKLSSFNYYYFFWGVGGGGVAQTVHYSNSLVESSSLHTWQLDSIYSSSTPNMVFLCTRASPSYLVVVSSVGGRVRG